MPRLNSANFAVTNLTSPINSSVNVFEVDDASAFPDTGPFMILVHDRTPGFAGVREIMEVTTIDKELNIFFNVIRGREGTTAVAHSAGARVECVWTAGTHQELECQSNKGQPGGYASLDASGNVPENQLGNVAGMEEHGNEWHDPSFLTMTDLEGHANGVGVHKKPARIVVGSYLDDWEEKDCDFLCYGIGDHTTINNAIAALPDGGGEIILLDGIYYISTSTIDGGIVIEKDNVVLRGNGNNTVLVRKTSAKSIIKLKSVTGCRIENLRFDKDASGYGDDECSVLVENSNDNAIIDIVCNNQYGAGIILESSHRNRISNNICMANGDGIQLSDSDSNIIIGNICQQNTSSGISLVEGCNNNIIKGNSCLNNTSDGIQAVTGIVNNVVGNVCNGNGDNGIKVYSANSAVSGNVCNNNGEDGIRVGSPNVAISGNTCFENSNVGISGRYGSPHQAAIVGNICKDNATGIRLDSSINNIIIGNICVRGEGFATDYTEDHYTIRVSSLGNSVVAYNNCTGKDVLVSSGHNNLIEKNKYTPPGS